MSQERFEVRHRPHESRYALVDRETGSVADGAEGDAATVVGEAQYLDIDRQGSRHRVFFHTEVSEEYGGQGLASELVREALRDTVEGGGTIVPVCPYVARWLSRHREYADQVVQPTIEHIRALRAHRPG